MEMNQEARTWAMFAHLSTFAGFVVPFGNLILPIIILSVKKDPFVQQEAREALNFQISMLIYTLICVVLAFVIIGIFLLIGLMVFEIVSTVVAALRANQGQGYRYAITMRLVN